MKRILFTLLLAILYCTQIATAQNNTNKGKEFWIGFIQAQGNNNSPCLISIYSNKSITGTVSIPSTGWSQNFSFAANSSVSINVDDSRAYGKGTGIFNTGILIQTSDSSWVTTITNNNPDGTSVLPIQSIGDDYFVNTHTYNNLNEEFLVVAIQDSTIIEITPTNAVPYKIILNKGQVYQLFSSENNPITIGGLSGFRIKIFKSNDCNPKIAVFSGSPTGNITLSTWDQFYEQLQPTYSLGKEFLTTSNNSILNYAFYTIVATEDNTSINLNGVNSSLNQGETLRTTITGEFHLKSDKPVSVAQYIGDKNKFDALMAIVPPLDQKIYDSDIYCHRSNLYIFTITIYTLTSNIDNVYFDGQKIISTNFITSLENPLHSYVSVSIPSNTDFHHINSSGGFYAFVYGILNGTSIGYSIGFGYQLPPEELEPAFSIVYAGDTTAQENFATAMCSCSPVELIVNNPSSSLLYKWEISDTTSAYGSILSHHFLNGDFQVKLTSMTLDSCILHETIKEHLLVQNCDISMSPSTPVCAEDSVVLSVNAGSSFLWNTGQVSQSIKVSPDQTTLYTVSVDGGAASICDSILVYVKGSKPTIDLGPTQTICKGKSVVLNASYDKASYVWQDNSTNSSFSASQEGAYWVTVTNLCGTDQDSFDLHLISPPKINLGNDLGICLEEQISICAVTTADSFLWSTGSKDSCITVAQPGTYLVQVGNSCFKRTDEIIVSRKICKELIFPNLITPNKDGLNDTFVIQGIEERDATFSVYNRWGDRIFLKEHFNNDWNAANIPDGVYYFLLEDHSTNATFKGWVQVLKGE